MHAYMHAHMHAYIRTCICAYMHTCIHAYMPTYVHTPSFTVVSVDGKMMKAPSNRRIVIALCLLICYPCANVVTRYDAEPVQKIRCDVCHLMPQITSSKLSKSLLAKCGKESLA